MFDLNAFLLVDFLSGIAFFLLIDDKRHILILQDAVFNAVLDVFGKYPIEVAVSDEIADFDTYRSDCSGLRTVFFLQSFAWADSNDCTAIEFLYRSPKSIGLFALDRSNENVIVQRLEFDHESVFYAFFFNRVN